MPRYQSTEDGARAKALRLAKTVAKAVLRQDDAGETAVDAAVGVLLSITRNTSMRWEMRKDAAKELLRHSERAFDGVLAVSKHLDDVGAVKEERLREIGWTPNGAAGTTNNILVSMGDDALRALAAGATLPDVLRTTTGGGVPVRSDQTLPATGDTTGGGPIPGGTGVEAVPDPAPDLRITQQEVTADEEPEAWTRAHAEWAVRQQGRYGHGFIHPTEDRCRDCGTRLDEEPHDCPVK